MARRRSVIFRVAVPLLVIVDGAVIALYFLNGLEFGDQISSILAMQVGLFATTFAVFAHLRHRETTTATVSRPAQLPAIHSRFDGRVDDLGRLGELLKRHGAVLISGTAGVGKTALVVHWAYRRRHRFRDGLLFVDLRGYDPDRPVTTAKALGLLLEGLGVDRTAVPTTLDARVTKYRSLIANRKILLVLDNAATADQVRLLIPGPGPARAVVTSRSRLGGDLALAEIRLERMSDEDCQSLLATLIGPRARDDADALMVVARYCAGLPLAMRLAAWLLYDQPRQTLADLAGELADAQALEALSPAGDPKGAMRTVFSWSYQGLYSESARRAFRLAGLHPGPDFDAHALAALTGHDIATAEKLLAELGRANLVEARGRGRYALHDLLRLYALDLSASTGEDDAARLRLFGYYRAASASAATTAYPTLQHTLRRFPPGDDVTVPGLPDAAAAQTWFAAEVPTLVRLALTASKQGHPEQTTDLSEIMFRHLDVTDLQAQATLVHGAAVEAAVDHRARGIALHNLAAAKFRHSRIEEARDLAKRGLAELRAAGDERGQALCLVLLGLIAFWHDERATALPFYEEAARHALAADDKLLHGRLLHNIGNIYFYAGDYPNAVDAFHRALALALRLGDSRCEAAAHSGLGIVAAAEGRTEDSVGHHEQTLLILRRIGDRTLLAGALAESADSMLELEQFDRALAMYEELLAISRELADTGDAELALAGRAKTLALQRRKRMHH
ncbi:tetratricopeptide repeat protein [Actinoplanes sp. NPDC026670]|uniref:tetratricopeptide repeat protein n=1 Tax=Actinoplanes sp. NPDC026670 TaxID=3154700 RepID=UPI0033F1B5D3